MTSQCTTNVMKIIVRKFSQNLFNNHIRHPISVIKKTSSDKKKNTVSDSVFSKFRLSSTKNFINENIFRSLIRPMNGLKEEASDLRQCSKTLLITFPTSNVHFQKKFEGDLLSNQSHISEQMKTNSNYNLLKTSAANQRNIFQNAFRRIHGFSGVMGHTASTIPNLYTSNSMQYCNRILLRTFATSSAYFKSEGDFFSKRNNFENKVIISNSNNNSSKHFAVKYDFPIIPITTKSKQAQQLQKVIKPIAQNYMPMLPLTDTKNLSEKVYRKIGSSVKSLVADLIFSFPFDTHSDAHKSHRLGVSTLDNGKMQEASLNLTTDQLSSTTTSRNSIWSIGNNFSFPSISRRFEASMKQLEETVVNEIVENSTLELKANI